MAMEYITQGNATGEDVWMNRYNTPWNRVA